MRFGLNSYDAHHSVRRQRHPHGKNRMRKTELMALIDVRKRQEALEIHVCEKCSMYSQDVKTPPPPKKKLQFRHYRKQGRRHKKLSARANDEK